MKMNEELKAFVQAYIDGEDVEYINHYENNNEYSKVTSLATFEYPTLVFRIKPKAEDKWQRVIDEQPWKQLIKHVERLDDTVTRLALEVAKLQENEDEPTSNDGGIPIPIHKKKIKENKDDPNRKRYIQTGDDNF